jgi:hypothetical protein
MPAVADDEAVAVRSEAHRRRLAALVEPLAIPLDRRRAEAAATACADPDLSERNPDLGVVAVVCAHRHLLSAVG